MFKNYIEAIKNGPTKVKLLCIYLGFTFLCALALLAYFIFQMFFNTPMLALWMFGTPFLIFTVIYSLDYCQRYFITKNNEKGSS